MIEYELDEPYDLPGEWVFTRRVLIKMALGLTQEEAAHELGCSRFTVRNHLQRAYEHLNVGTLVGALRAMGWLVVPNR